MHELAKIFRLFNVPDAHEAEWFTKNVISWCEILLEELKLPPEKFSAQLPRILARAWKSTGIRVHLCEIAEEWGCVLVENEFGHKSLGDLLPRIIKAVRFAFQFPERTALAVGMFREIDRKHPGASEFMTILWSDRKFSTTDTAKNVWLGHSDLNNWPAAVFYISDHDKEETLQPIAEPEQMTIDFLESIQQIRSGLLSGQKDAFDALGLMLLARRENLTAGGISPRLHALIIGPSGSGKTHVVREFSRAVELPLFEQSAASWMPNGSRAEVGTAVKIARFVNANKEGIIFIDEVEKPFPRVLSTSSAWERANADEMMSILDAKTVFWDGWNPSLAAKLDAHFFIVLSGAWQDAYMAGFKVHELLGGDWSNLSIADTFFDENHLPQELLNRVSTNIVEVLSPSQSELARMVVAVQADLGIAEDESEAMRVAAEILEGRKGVRGVEEYMLRAWMKKTEPRVTFAAQDWL